MAIIPLKAEGTYKISRRGIKVNTKERQSNDKGWGGQKEHKIPIKEGGGGMLLPVRHCSI
jgi:hypothetical protein